MSFYDLDIAIYSWVAGIKIYMILLFQFLLPCHLHDVENIQQRKDLTSHKLIFLLLSPTATILICESVNDLVLDIDPIYIHYIACLCQSFLLLHSIL